MGKDYVLLGSESPAPGTLMEAHHYQSEGVKVSRCMLSQRRGCSLHRPGWVWTHLPWLAGPGHSCPDLGTCGLCPVALAALTQLKVECRWGQRNISTAVSPSALRLPVFYQLVWL